MSPLSHVRELVADRTLLWSMVKQDLKLKYRGSVLGFVWALVNPLLMLTVMALAFTFVFNRHYPLHLFATLLPWQFFQNSQTEGCRAITSSASIIMNWKVPLLVFPVRRTLFRFCEYLFALVGLGAIASCIGFRLSPAITVLPLSLLLLLMFSMGLSVFLSVVATYFHDLQHCVDVIFRAWFYLSPVLIPASSIPEQHKWVLWCNPMYYFLELFDAPIARAEWPSLECVLAATALAVASNILAVLAFDRNESGLVFRL